MRVLTAKLSEDAYDGWRGFATASGTTMSALVEALGLRFTDNSLPGWFKGVVEDARAIDVDRRGRERPV